MDQMPLLQVVDQHTHILYFRPRRVRRRTMNRRLVVVIVADEFNERLLAGKAGARLRELPFGYRALDEFVFHVPSEFEDRPANEHDDEQRERRHDSQDYPEPRALGRCHQDTCFSNRRASSADVWSLSLSHRRAAVRKCSAAADRAPSFCERRPSSKCARPCTHFRASPMSALLRSTRASAARPNAVRAAPRLYHHKASSPNIR